jgi:hypothetical protein
MYVKEREYLVRDKRYRTIISCYILGKLWFEDGCVEYFSLFYTCKRWKTNSSNRSIYLFSFYFIYSCAHKHTHTQKKVVNVIESIKLSLDCFFFQLSLFTQGNRAHTLCTYITTTTSLYRLYTYINWIQWCARTCLYLC